MATRKRIVPLSELKDHAVVAGDPDVRGWEVIGSDRRTIGTVEELLVDTGTMKVRYIDVNASRSRTPGADAPHVLVPVGYARLNEGDCQVFVEGVEQSMLEGIGSYERVQGQGDRGSLADRKVEGTAEERAALVEAAGAWALESAEREAEEVGDADARSRSGDGAGAGSREADGANGAAGGATSPRPPVPGDRGS